MWGGMYALAHLSENKKHLNERLINIFIFLFMTPLGLIFKLPS